MTVGDRKTLRLDGLSMAYGAVRVLDGIDLEVHTGEIHGLIGSNGSGKTTLFNCVSGFARPVAGSVTWEGADITRWSSARIARSGVVRTFQEARVFSALSVASNVRIAAEARKRTYRSLPVDPGQLLDLVDLGGKRNTVARELAYGDQRKLGVAMALAIHPDLLLLDEPAVGLTPEERVDFRDLLQSITKLGIGMLIIEHDMGFLLNLANYVSVLAAGAKIFAGTPVEVQASDAVADAYLGRSHDDTHG